MLKGHTRPGQCLAALDGDRLASGSWDKSIIIWNLADGTQLAKLEGHTDEVDCLAALDGDRLASGRRGPNPSSSGTSRTARSSPSSRGTRATVRCLAALDGDRLASGNGGDRVHHHLEPRGRQAARQARGAHKCRSIVIRIWRRSTATGSPSDGAARDNSIIIWNLADGTQLAKLEGHTDPVACLAALDGGRLASGGVVTSPSSSGTSRTARSSPSSRGTRAGSIAWPRSMAAGSRSRRWRAPKRKAESSSGTSRTARSSPSSRDTRTGSRCLAALAGGRLASGSDDLTIRVRPVLHSAAYNFAAVRFQRSSSRRPLEGCREKNVSATSSTAAVQQFDEK